MIKSKILVWFVFFGCLLFSSCFYDHNTKFEEMRVGRKFMVNLESKPNYYCDSISWLPYPDHLILHFKEDTNYKVYIWVKKTETLVISSIHE